MSCRAAWFTASFDMDGFETCHPASRLAPSLPGWISWHPASYDPFVQTFSWCKSFHHRRRGMLPTRLPSPLGPAIIRERQKSKYMIIWVACYTPQQDSVLFRVQRLLEYGTFPHGPNIWMRLTISLVQCKTELVACHEHSEPVLLLKFWVISTSFPRKQS